MTTIISAHGPHDFLAIVPHLTGFVPERSIVLVAMRGNRSCGALRFDLPPDGSRALLKRVATSFVGMLCKIPGVDALVPVVYTAESIVGGVVPHTDLMAVLRERAGFSGFLVRDALCVAANGWGSSLDEQLPERGYPVAMIAASPAARELPCEPNAQPRTVADGQRLPFATEKARRDTARALPPGVERCERPAAPAVGRRRNRRICLGGRGSARIDRGAVRAARGSGGHLGAAQRDGTGCGTAAVVFWACDGATCGGGSPGVPGQARADKW